MFHTKMFQDIFILLLLFIRYIKKKEAIKSYKKEAMTVSLSKAGWRHFIGFRWHKQCVTTRFVLQYEYVTFWKCFSGESTHQRVSQRTVCRGAGRLEPERKQLGEARPDLLEELRPAATSDSALIWEPLGVKGEERESSLSNFGIKRRIYLPSQLSICLQRRVGDLPSVALPPGRGRNLHLWRFSRSSHKQAKKQTITTKTVGNLFIRKTCTFVVDYGECWNQTL